MRQKICLLLQNWLNKHLLEASSVTIAAPSLILNTGKPTWIDLLVFVLCTFSFAEPGKPKLNFASKNCTARVDIFILSFQLTLWGPKGEHLDYAYKHWSGLVNDYYKPRWNLFFKKLEESLIFGTAFNKDKFKEEFFEQIGTPFTNDRKMYPTMPEGDSAKIAIELHQKYRPNPEIFNYT